MFLCECNSTHRLHFTPASILTAMASHSLLQLPFKLAEAVIKTKEGQDLRKSTRSLFEAGVVIVVTNLVMKACFFHLVYMHMYIFLPIHLSTLIFNNFNYILKCNLLYL